MDAELKEQLKSLHAKLDKYHDETIKNTTDIAWLKRGMFGSFFTYAGALLWTKVGG